MTVTSASAVSTANTPVTTFVYTGADEFYTVDPGVEAVLVNAVGAAGGGGGVSGGRGGHGADISAVLATTAGSIFTVRVGGHTIRSEGGSASAIVEGSRALVAGGGGGGVNGHDGGDGASGNVAGAETTTIVGGDGTTVGSGGGLNGQGGLSDAGVGGSASSHNGVDGGHYSAGVGGSGGYYLSGDGGSVNSSAAVGGTSTALSSWQEHDAGQGGGGAGFGGGGGGWAGGGGGGYGGGGGGSHLSGGWTDFGSGGAGGSHIPERLGNPSFGPAANRGDGKGKGTTSEGAEGTVIITALDRPTIDSASATGSHTGSVAWTAPATQPAGAGTVTYRVFAQGVEQTDCQSTAASGTCTVRGLPASSGVELSVLATTVSGLATRSAPASITTPAAPVNPQVPGKMKARVKYSKSKAVVSWATPTPGSSPILGFDLRTSTNNGKSYGAKRRLTKQSFTVARKPGKKYVVQVAAVNGAGRGETATVRLKPFSR